MHTPKVDPESEAPESTSPESHLSEPGGPASSPPAFCFSTEHAKPAKTCLRTIPTTSWSEARKRIDGRTAQPMSQLGQKQTLNSECSKSALPLESEIQRHHGDVRFVPPSDSRTATNTSVFDQLVGEQQGRFQDGQPERLARGFKPDIGNPVALAPAQSGLVTLVLEGCRRASKQRRFYILKCVHADDGVEAAVDSAGDHRHHATPGAHVKLGSLGAERVF